METHDCRTCGVAFPATEEFFYRTREFFNWKCKACLKAYVLAWKREKEDRPGFREFTCQFCGSVFRSAKRSVRTCSTKCHVDLRHVGERSARLALKEALDRSCLHCGVAIPASKDIRAVYCSERCNSAAHMLSRKTAGRAGTERYRIHRAAIGDRDGWRCSLCRKKIDGRLRHPDPLAPSIDHIVPLSRGGSNDLANLQMVHLRCNLSKQAGPRNEQLRLVG